MAPRTPEMLVSPIRHKFSRQALSLIARAALLLIVELAKLRLQPRPVDPLGHPHQRMTAIDHVLQQHAEKLVFRRARLLGLHRQNPPMRSNHNQKSGATPRVRPRIKTQAFCPNSIQTLQNRMLVIDKIKRVIMHLRVFHGRLARQNVDDLWLDVCVARTHAGSIPAMRINDSMVSRNTTGPSRSITGHLTLVVEVQKYGCQWH